MTTEKITLKQDFGPTIQFRGTLLADTDFETKKGGVKTGDMVLEVWETEGGAYIAYSELKYSNGAKNRRATVIEQPYREDGRDTEYMQRAVLDAFDWNSHARSMMRDAGWSLTWKVA